LNEDILKKKELISVTPVRARFSEVDAMSIAWHGSYVKYLEDGREDFGIKFGLDYMSVYRSGFMTPVVKLNIDYKSPLLYEMEAQIKTKFINSPAAKIRFEYELTCTKTGRVLMTAYTEQVFIDASTRELYLTIPPFFGKWKKDHGLEI